MELSLGISYVLFGSNYTRDSFKIKNFTKEDYKYIVNLLEKFYNKGLDIKLEVEIRKRRVFYKLIVGGKEGSKC